MLYNLLLIFLNPFLSKVKAGDKKYNILSKASFTKREIDGSKTYFIIMFSRFFAVTSFSLSGVSILEKPTTDLELWCYLNNYKLRTFDKFMNRDGFSFHDVTDEQLDFHHNLKLSCHITFMNMFVNPVVFHFKGLMLITTINLSSPEMH